eukprot:TRINITY_DN136646_c0_g1_i1.p1 TRINITY_DN136646_c0_g1~~TRINITY_DN136646_c0_g1_i1.p1  ORF type:complete len:156 (+),score=37.15 TRINITY_DN136646_c0_g1_i1:29-469(+)
MSRRLGKEFQQLSETAPQDWLEVQLVNDNLYNWRVVMLGPEGSPYENGKFLIDLNIPSEYPFKHPQVKYLVKVYHPNVNDDGTICEELFEPWSPQKRILDVCTTLRTQLADPDVETPLNLPIAEIYKNDFNKFEKTAKDWTKKFAK